jgi:hypothetical protein
MSFFDSTGSLGYVVDRFQKPPYFLPCLRERQILSPAQALRFSDALPRTIVLRFGRPIANFPLPILLFGLWKLLKYSTHGKDLKILDIRAWKHEGDGTPAGSDMEKQRVPVP